LERCKEEICSVIEDSGKGKNRVIDDGDGTRKAIECLKIHTTSIECLLKDTKRDVLIFGVESRFELALE
jgi:hypothetical protein